MRIEFEEEFGIPVQEVYEYFRTPMHWPLLFPAFGETRELGDGRYVVPFRGLPFPLVARITRDEPSRRVEWTLGGFWRGEGKVRFEPTHDGVTVSGYEQVSPRWLWPAPLAERLFLEARFRRVWESGWRRLRRRAAGRRDHSLPKGE